MRSCVCVYVCRVPSENFKVTDVKQCVGKKYSFSSFFGLLRLLSSFLKHGADQLGPQWLKFVGWLLNVPATYQSISGTDLLGHIEIELADQTLYLTQSQYTGSRPTSPSFFFCTHIPLCLYD